MLAHAPVAVAAKRVLPVLKEMVAPLLRVVRRRSPALNSSLPARHRANSSSRSHHHRRSNINIDDTDLTRTDAHPLHSPEWPRRRFDILSHREAELIATSSSRGARATLPNGEGFERGCVTRRSRREDVRGNVLRINSTEVQQQALRTLRHCEIILGSNSSCRSSDSGTIHKS